MSSLPVAPPRNIQDDDSEDDPDFVPPADDPDSSESENESRDAKKQKVSTLETEDDRAKKDEARKKLWEDFQKSVSTPPSRKEAEVKRTVKIVKKYRFAGEDVTKVEEVPEDSPDAKKWPLWTVNTQTPLPKTVETAPSTPSPIPSSSSTPQPEPDARPAQRRPKKPRKSLDAMLATAKAKKLSTLDKSAMDWKEHVESSQDIKEDLEANRRGGGYLEKVEFLQRVEERAEAARESGRKRRRG